MSYNAPLLDLARRAEEALGNADAPDILLGAIGQQAEALEEKLKG